MADVEEFTKGIKTYFDRALGSILLYKFEKRQFKQQLADAPSAPASSIYGLNHLLRLFVKLPTLLAHTNMGEEDIKDLQSHLADLAKFLHQSQSVKSAAYEKATKDYIAASAADE